MQTSQILQSQSTSSAWSHCNSYPRRQWFEDLATGRAQSLTEIAESEGVTRRYVAHLVPLAFLAPDIVSRILSGTQPVSLTTEELTKRIDLPLEWAEQRTLLGFD